MGRQLDPFPAVAVADRSIQMLSILLRALFQALYDGKWHQLKLLVRPQQVSGFLDDREIRQVPLEAGQPIYINGKTQLAKRVRSNSSVPVKLKHRQGLRFTPLSTAACSK